ncbi:MAG: methyltransferase, partial [Ginsengibacter sp.]
MKVCTDACVFGGWLANKMTIIGRDSQNFLDIGTGTGLLSLMVAQKSSVEIDAIEIEENAFVQARENFRSSPWSKVLHAIHGDVTTYPFRKKYDLIICNPPFYESDLRSPDDKKNQARHDESLRLDELVNVVSNLLNSDG